MKPKKRNCGLARNGRKSFFQPGIGSQCHFNLYGSGRRRGHSKPPLYSNRCSAFWGGEQQFSRLKQVKCLFRTF